MEIWFPIPSWLFWTILGIGFIVFIFQKIFGESTDGSREVMPTPQRIRGNCPGCGLSIVTGIDGGQCPDCGYTIEVILHQGKFYFQ